MNAFFFKFLITVICKFFIYFISTQWIGHRLMLPSQYVQFKKYKLGGGGLLSSSGAPSHIHQTESTQKVVL